MFDDKYIPGILSPKEYPWKEQFERLAQEYSDHYAPFVSLDIGKVLGLAQYADELEQEIERLKKEGKGAVNGTNRH